MVHRRSDESPSETNRVSLRLRYGMVEERKVDQLQQRDL